MSGTVVSDDISHARFERHSLSVFKFGLQLATQDMEDMSAAAPVVCEITGRISNETKPKFPKLSYAPICCSGFTGMEFLRYGRPVDCREVRGGRQH